MGGRQEKGETIGECANRETKEETGYDVHSLKCAGKVLFIDEKNKIMMYVYEIEDFSGKQIKCNEGTLKGYLSKIFIFIQYGKAIKLSYLY